MQAQLALSLPFGPPHGHATAPASQLGAVHVRSGGAQSHAQRFPFEVHCSFRLSSISLLPALF
jgi:hypothetical protein